MNNEVLFFLIHIFDRKQSFLLVNKLVVFLPAAFLGYFYPQLPPIMKKKTIVIYHLCDKSDLLHNLRLLAHHSESKVLTAAV